MFYCFKPINSLMIRKIGIWRLFSNKSIQSTDHVLRQTISELKINIRNKFVFKTNSLPIRPNRWSLSVISGGLICVSYVVWHKNRAKCEFVVQQIVEECGDDCSKEVDKSVDKEEEEFDLLKLWSFIKPDSLYLLIAITSALIVAILNIEIPLSLGAVINVLSRFANEYNSTFWSNNFYSEIKVPALKVLQLYIFQIIGCSISLFVISPKLTLWMSGIVPAMVLSGAFFGSFLRQMSKEAQEETAKASGISSESINNVRTVKAFAMEDNQKKVYDKQLAIAEEMNINLGIGIGVLQGVTNLALNGIVLGTLLFGGHLLSREEITAGNLISFLVATQTIQRSLSQLSLLFGHYVRGISAANRVFEYMNVEPNIVLNKGLKLKEIVGEVQFKNVRFSYPTRSEHIVLNNFNLKLIPGKVTAICGLSGEGKSTIASLLERFYDIDSGAITLDGYDIKSLDPTWLRGHVIGFINQEPILFGTTIMENIRFGKPEATDEEVVTAAKQANADSFIRHFPDGYQTIVGERGVTVSGGQKQRLAIARALIKNPSILILDEATSALDTESESLVQEALEKVMKNRTVLVIAHRLSTIQSADIIAVISKGKIVEIGNHSQLINTQGLYWNLIRQQFDTNGNKQ